MKRRVESALPCPFCGTDPEVERVSLGEWPEAFEWTISCWTRLCVNPRTSDAKRIRAVRRWNKRGGRLRGPGIKTKSGR